MTEDAIRRIKTIGHDLLLMPLCLIEDEFNRVCFILLNNYTVPSYRLGLGPCSDALVVAKTADVAGMDVYFLHNPRKETFLSYFDKVLELTTSCLFFFFVGHGYDIPDTKKEGILFDDGFVPDSEMLDHLIQYKNPNSTLILLTDATQSGLVWKIKAAGSKVPPNVLSISAISETDKAKKLSIARIDQNIFTENIHKLLKEDKYASIKQMERKLTSVLKQFGQTLSIQASSPELIVESLLQPKEVDDKLKGSTSKSASKRGLGKGGNKGAQAKGEEKDDGEAKVDSGADKEEEYIPKDPPSYAKKTVKKVQVEEPDTSWPQPISQIQELDTFEYATEYGNYGKWYRKQREIQQASPEYDLTGYTPKVYSTTRPKSTDKKKT